MEHILNTHFVEFDKWCQKCEHKDLKDDEDPCNECLAEPVNENSRRPVNFKKHVDLD